MTSFVIPSDTLENVLESQFIDRPNQFLVRCYLKDGTVIRAFLPNPGRMWELLLPETRLFLSENKLTSEKRKTQYTVIGAEREGTILFLHTGLTNCVARYLIEANKIPSLVNSMIAATEIRVGHNRFDFLLSRGEEKRYLEVKSCTLYGNRIAMFPDAITTRGKKHLLALAALSKEKIKPIVLFVVHTPHVDWFMPDYHSDIEFSRTLLEVQKDIEIRAISVSWNRNFSIGKEVRELKIPWNFLNTEVADRGAYLLLLHIARRRRIQIGKLGTILFERGHYVYVGSAMVNLGKRLARHTRRRKRMHWHIDYLRQNANSVITIPIRTSKRIECDLANELNSQLGIGIQHFGSSDCACNSHLYHSKDNPFDRRDFHDLLHRFRMQQPLQQ